MTLELLQQRHGAAELSALWRQTWILHKRFRRHFALMNDHVADSADEASLRVDSGISRDFQATMAAQYVKSPLGDKGLTVSQLHLI